MPYLNLDLDYFSHPKIMRFVARLGVEHIAMPLKLWCYVGKYHPATGSFNGYNGEEIERVLGWNGPQGMLIETLADPKIKLLEQCRGTYHVHDWKEHAGHLMAFKKRAITANKARWEKLATSNATRTRNDAITDPPNQSYPNHPNHPNQTKSKKKIQKEKEEKKENTCGDVSQLSPPGLSSLTFAAYAQAYEKRYHAQPVRNHSVNSQLCQVVKALGVEEAPFVAAFYLTCNNPVYINSRHAVNLLLRDVTGLRTQWVTGVKATRSEAESAEQIDSLREQAKRVQQQMKGGHR